MERFKMGALSDWMPVGSRLDWRCQVRAGVCTLTAKIVGKDVECYAVTEEGQLPLAFGSGLMEVEFTCEGACTFVVISEAAAVLIREAPSQMAASGKESFTSLEPRGRSAAEAERALFERSMRNANKRNLRLAGLLRGEK